jgi:hypothetical protein
MAYQRATGWQVRAGLIFSIMLGVFALLPACTFLSNRSYTEKYPQYRGIKRVAVFIKHWPAYQQLPNQNDLGDDFIKKTTLFTGPWQPASFINPRAVDVLDIDDQVMGALLSRALQEKGYEPFISGVLPENPGPITVEEIMAKSRVVDRQVDACLFCFYSPTLYCADPQHTPKEHQKRSFGLQEIIGILNPGANYVIWAGPRAGEAPPNSISHAFIYVSLTMFKAQNFQPLWEVADSQLGGRMRLTLAECPPGPTDENYPADAAIIQHLMTSNLKCRLAHLIPDAF